MSQTYVAIDLETTGLSPAADEIIEIGALKFNEDRVIDTFSTFVNPGRPVPYRIRLLTGISDDDVVTAPPFAEVADELLSFIGNNPIVGQNVGFDLGFLARKNIHARGPVYDTVELALLLLPGLSEYSLHALARYFGVHFPVRHRALPDATATKDVFLALLDRAAGLPPDILAEAAALGGLDWAAGRLLQDIAQRQLTTSASRSLLRKAAVSAHEKAKPSADTIASQPAGIPIARDEVITLLRRAASQPDLWPGYEERPQQLTMAGAVADALSNGHHLLVEAGTGVGKSLAYLLPAMLYAYRNSSRIVISTDTISLQDQLIKKDIPLALRLLSTAGTIAAPEKLRASQLKGRRNYLCLRRWDALRRSGGRTPEEGRLAARLLLWLTQTETGDRAEIRISSQEEATWARLNAQNEDCLSNACPYVRDGTCFLLKARKRAEAAHIVVVNHALLLSDLAAEGRVLPSYDRLIIDEAHNLEERATQQFSFTASEGDLAALLDRLHQSRPSGGGAVGVVAVLRSVLRGLAQPLSPASQMLAITDALAEAIERGRRRSTDFFASVQRFLAAHGSGNSEYEQRLLLTPNWRVRPDWADVELAWDNLALSLGEIAAWLARLGDDLRDADGLGLPQYDDFAAEIADSQQGLQTISEGMRAVVRGDDPSRICWLAGRPNGGYTQVASAPLEVAPILRERLFGKKDSVILTSATLAQPASSPAGPDHGSRTNARHSFEYIRERIGLDEAEELVLGSPFDYRRSTLLLLPRDIPDPSRAEYNAAVARAVIELCQASNGRALVLFTSYAALRSVYAQARGPLQGHGMDLLAQGIDGTPQQLLDALRRQHRTVLLGTSSFWEGIDVVGDALSLLIIAKLPFSVPDDPIFVARSALLREPFMRYALPQAVLRFKQGFGRLIRHRDDRGVVVVLDPRLRSRSYGAAFLGALPECAVRTEPLAQLPPLVARWLARDKR